MKHIYCHPLFDERKCSHRFSYQLQCAFANKGRKLQRFDYTGTGEASGEFCNVTFDRLRNDLQLKAQIDCISLIGTRLGATVAFDYSCKNNTNVQNLILIEPVVNGKTYTDYLIRKQHLKNLMTGNKNNFLAEEGFYNLEGYKTSCKLIDQISKISLTKRAADLKTPKNLKIIQVSAYSKINKDFAKLADSLQKNGIETSVKVFNLPTFWERICANDYSSLTQRIAEWCND